MTGPVESKADTIVRLRRRMAEIPARSDTSPRPSLAVFAPDRPSADRPPQAPAPTPRTLPAPAPIAQLLPHRGLVSGSIVQLSGATALHAGLVASVTESGGWAALIGTPRVGLLAATEMGANLQRCAIVPDPGPDPIAVAAVLVDGIDLVVLSLAGADVPPSRARAIPARARRTGAILVVTDGHWPTVDLHLDARVAGYRGLGAAGGRITGVDLTVEARARGHQPRRADVEITGRAGGVTWVATQDDSVPLKVAR